MNEDLDIENIDKIIELMTDLVFFKNPKGQYIKCNQAFLKFIQKDRAEVINKTDHELFSKENADEFVLMDKSIFENNEGLEFEEVFILENQEKVYFKTTKKILYNASGEALGLFCIAKNITVNKQFEIIYEDNKNVLEFIAKEDNLERTLKKLISLSESRNSHIKCSILFLDKSGKYLGNVIAPKLPSFYNEALKKIKVSPKAGSCGAAAFNKERVIVENINEHENWKSTLELTKKANLHACWSQPIISSNNELLGTFAIYSDRPSYPSDYELRLISSYAHLASVAIEKDLNYKLLQEKEILILNQSKMASLGEMLENIAHQWRQPLSIISTAASGIKLQKDMSLLDEHTFTNSLDSILESTNYLSTTIDSFRDYFKTSNKKEKFYIDSCIEKSKNAMQSALDEKNILIIGNMPHIEIYEVENELIQVFLNLFKNSYDIFDKNSEKNLIFISYEIKGNEITLYIKDNAGGIEDNIINRVFEPYFTTKHKAQGTGIGLFMSKEIIERQMEGSLSVKNKFYTYEKEDYKGAMFSITLSI